MKWSGGRFDLVGLPEEYLTCDCDAERGRAGNARCLRLRQTAERRGIGNRCMVWAMDDGVDVFDRERKLN
jgi:hypothetical protein